MAVVPRKNAKHGTIYQVRVLDPFGHWYPSKSFVSKKDARTENERLLQLCRKGVAAPPTDRRTATLSAYWQHWRKECRSGVSDSWNLSQDQMFADHIKPRLGTLKLAAIRPQHIQSLLNEMKRQGYSDQTRLHAFNLLHKMFEDALDEDDSAIFSNPARKKLRPKVVIRERAFLPPPEAHRLLDAAKDDYLGPLIWIGLLVGLRSEALLPLRVGRIDLERGEILIAECLKRKVKRVEDKPKGGRQEYVPIPKMLADYLRPLLAGKAPDDFVVNGKRGEMVSYNTLLDGLTRLCAKAGVRRITPHEMRHSTSELWYEFGASDEDVRRLLNQKSATTIKRYTHRSDGRLKGIAERMNSSPTVLAPPPGPAPEPAARSPAAFDGQVEGSEGAKVIVLRPRRA